MQENIKENYSRYFELGEINNGSFQEKQMKKNYMTTFKTMLKGKRNSFRVISLKSTHLVFEISFSSLCSEQKSQREAEVIL